MTDHTCRELTKGCYRCDLNRDEIEHARMEARIEARALRDAAERWQDYEFVEVEWLREAAAELEREVGA